MTRPTTPRPRPAPLVRHAVAPDPNPEKVRAALEYWASALARKLTDADQTGTAQPGGALPRG